MRINWSSDKEKFWKFETEGKIQRSLYSIIPVGSYKLEQIELKLEKIIGIQKHAVNVREKIPE